MMKIITTILMVGIVLLTFILPYNFSLIFAQAKTEPSPHQKTEQFEKQDQPQALVSKDATQKVFTEIDRLWLTYIVPALIAAVTGIFIGFLNAFFIKRVKIEIRNKVKGENLLKEFGYAIDRDTEFRRSFFSLFLEDKNTRDIVRRIMGLSYNDIREISRHEVERAHKRETDDAFRHFLLYSLTKNDR